MFKRRFLFMLVGCVLLGVSTGFLRTAAFGIDPFTSMTTALSELFGVSFGTFQLCFNIALLLVVVFGNHSLIGIGTIVNMSIIGYVVDFTLWLMNGYAPGGFARVLWLVVGIVLLCFSTALYMAADLGISPYDAQAVILNEKTRRSFRLLRVGTDSLCVLIALIALLFGGNDIGELVGIGTILTALCTGPLIQFFRDHVAAPLLHRGEAQSRVQ